MNRLKELRKEKGLTQQQLADIVGITRRGYQKWENGESSIKSEQAQKLADFFDVNISYLLGGSIKNIPNAREVPYEMPDGTVSYFTFEPLNKTTEDFDKEVIISYINNLLKEADSETLGLIYNLLKKTINIHGK